jgi:hypothetical protein
MVESAWAFSSNTVASRTTVWPQSNQTCGLVRLYLSLHLVLDVMLSCEKPRHELRHDDGPGRWQGLAF